MLNTFYGVLGALVVKDILVKVYLYIELYYIQRKGRQALKDLRVFRDHIEDLEADDVDD